MLFKVLMVNTVTGSQIIISCSSSLLSESHLNSFGFTFTLVYIQTHLIPNPIITSRLVIQLLAAVELKMLICKMMKPQMYQVSEFL